MAKASPGPLVAQVSGRLGELIVVNSRSGLVLRRRPVYRCPVAPAQKAVHERMKQATAAWNTLTAAQAAAWNAYAQTLARPEAEGGGTARSTGFNAFSGLAMKYLQIVPGGSPPLVPPASGFVGDGIAVTVAGGTGQIVFTASGPNAAPAQTELLLQPLKNARRAPLKFYKSAAFVAFAAGSLSHAVSVEAGWYAAAFRFVNALTGQETLLQKIGVVEVS